MANDIDGIKNVKDVLSVCCIAEKQIQRLLDNVNEALSMNDIEEIHEVIFYHFKCISYTKMHLFCVKCFHFTLFCIIHSVT